MRVIEDLAGDWRRLDERIEALSAEIEAIARRDAGRERLMSVPGIGPIVSSAIVAAIGKGDGFGKGRDFAAWLGLVPKQISTGDRTIVGKISKRGNRVLFVQAAWVVLIKPKSWERHGLKPWLEAPASGRTTTCSPSRSLTSWRASPGAYLANHRNFETRQRRRHVHSSLWSKGRHAGGGRRFQRRAEDHAAFQSI